jgi:Zn-dependent peptidase ImmA (M78 family)
MYETLLNEAHEEKLEVVELHFRGRIKGLYCDRVIGINRNMTTAEKACVLAEELGHYHTSVGDILDQSQVVNRKQEKRARRWGYERLVPLDKLIEAYEAGVRNRQELSGFLGVTEKTFLAALKHYQGKLGLQHQIRNYIFFFEPLMIFKEIE